MLDRVRCSRPVNVYCCELAYLDTGYYIIVSQAVVGAIDDTVLLPPTRQGNITSTLKDWPKAQCKTSRKWSAEEKKEKSQLPRS